MRERWATMEAVDDDEDEEEVEEFEADESDEWDQTDEDEDEPLEDHYTEPELPKLSFRAQRRKVIVKSSPRTARQHC